MQLRRSRFDQQKIAGTRACSCQADEVGGDFLLGLLPRSSSHPIVVGDLSGGQAESGYGNADAIEPIGWCPALRAKSAADQRPRAGHMTLHVQPPP